MELLVYRFALQIVILSGWVRLPYDSPEISSYSLMEEHCLGMTDIVVRFYVRAPTIYIAVTEWSNVTDCNPVFREFESHPLFQL